MKEHIVLQGVIPESFAGKRLDQALAALFPDYSRTRIQAWIKAEQIQVDGKVLKIRDKVAGGESVKINATLEDQADWSAQAIALDEVYVDDDLIVLNKPVGLVVHPGAGHYDNTLVNALVYHYPELKTLPRAGVVHRLDKDTSGLMVVARTLTAHTHLVEQLQTHQVQRRYEAIVRGVLTAGGTVNAPIGRHKTQRTRMAVVTTGKPAITHYRVIQRFVAHTHIRVQLETGRTHQIRVHMAHMGYPLVGDSVYAGRYQRPAGISDAMAETLLQFKRQALHAVQLSLVHPRTAKTCEWQVPLPEDMLGLLAALRA